MSSLDAARFRETLGHFPTGVVLIAAMQPDGEPVGMVVGSFTSVSLEPPLVAYLPARTSRRYGKLQGSSNFCVNVFAASQEALCRRFASPVGEPFRGLEWTMSPLGSPILKGSVAWIDCTTHSVIEAGDHDIVVGEVKELKVLNAGSPLIFFQGGYGRFAFRSLVAKAAPELIAAVNLAELARGTMEQLAAELEVQCDVVAAVGGDLTFVASANSDSSAATTPTLGMRVPLVAPMGEQFIAWRDPESIRRWLEAGGALSAEEEDDLLMRLTIARERGWSVSRITSAEEAPLYQALREYEDDDYTPAGERRLRQNFRSIRGRYAPVDLAPGRRYEVHSIMAPVFSPEGPPQLALMLSNFPGSLSSDEILMVANRLVGATTDLAVKVAKT
jgi:flavin reductase (DIM6/NTAB) family NADH-FMN oxidoreductase RutF